MSFPFTDEGLRAVRGLVVAKIAELDRMTEGLVTADMMAGVSAANARMMAENLRGALVPLDKEVERRGLHP
jgi:hypothetical protein